MKKHNNGYYALLHLLNKYPEFNGYSSNPCDAEIIAFGKQLWEEWELLDMQKQGIIKAADIDRPQERAVIEMTEKGETPKAISEKLQISINSVYTARSIHKEAFKPSLPPLTAVQVKHIVESTGTLRQAASVAGITVPQLRKMMVKFGIKKEVEAGATGH